MYKGFEDDISRTVAIKVLHPSYLESRSDEDIVFRFGPKAKVAAYCMHPNIVTIFDYDISTGLHYIAMEYLEGINLKLLRRKEKTLPHRQAGDIIIELHSALDYAHLRGCDSSGYKARKYNYSQNKTRESDRLRHRSNGIARNNPSRNCGRYLRAYDTCIPTR